MLLLVSVHGKVNFYKKEFDYVLFAFVVREIELNFVVYSLVLAACDNYCQLFLPAPV